MEQWKDIKGFEGQYKVSSYGRFWSDYKSKRYSTPYMKPYTDSNGYLMVEIKGKAYLAHRLVAEYFLPEPTQYMIDEALKTKNKKVLVNHKDGNKQNNNYTNLEWCTYSGNMLHSFDIGTQIPPCGSNNNMSKLSDTDVLNIKSKYNVGLRDLISSLATEYNVKPQAITDILNNITWKHLKE